MLRFVAEPMQQVGRMAYGAEYLTPLLPPRSGGENPWDGQRHLTVRDLGPAADTREGEHGHPGQEGDTPTHRLPQAGRHPQDTTAGKARTALDIF